MDPRLRSPRFLTCCIVLACACGFLLWNNHRRIQHLVYVSGATEKDIAVDPRSPTGYAGGVRQLIVSGNDPRSYEQIAQVQQMFARGEWHIRHVDYDNTPFGRAVESASPYRWWLALTAWVDHAVSGRSLALSTERAAYVADPILHLLLLIGTTVFVARRFGAVAATLVALGIATSFPFAGAFLGGEPQDDGLVLIAAIWSVLPLVAARAGPASARTMRRGFALAGVAGGFGLWLSVGRETPVLAGVILGALLDAAVARRSEPADALVEPPPWRIWALGGAVTILAACLLEGLPSHDPGIRLDVFHPLHGVAWLGLGELLARADRLLRGGKFSSGRRDGARAGIALAAVAVPLAIALRHAAAVFSPDPLSERLTSVMPGAVAGTFFSWIQAEGFSPVVLTTIVPALLIVPAAWLIATRLPDPRHRSAGLLALGPAVLALILACFHLRSWNLLDGMLLPLLAVASLAVAKSAGSRRPVRWLWPAGVAAALLPGAILLAPARGSAETVTIPEVEALVERQLAHWLASRSGGTRPVVLASPNLSACLAFHGGLQAVATPYPENHGGLAAALRIAASTSQDEAFAQIQRRGVTDVVLASWDPFLDDYVRLGKNRNDTALLTLLQRWMPPRWLRPVPYQLPQIPGFEGRSVVLFEVVDLQDNALALSRLAEYFVEMGQLDLAASASDALARLFPDDLGATAARVQASAAIGNAEALRSGIDALETQLGNGGARSLPWDRRVSLAIALAQAKRFDQARPQMELCLAGLDEARLRSLTTDSLYRFEQLLKAFALPVRDDHLRQLARDLLPAEMRASL